MDISGYIEEFARKRTSPSSLFDMKTARNLLTGDGPAALINQDQYDGDSEFLPIHIKASVKSYARNKDIAIHVYKHLISFLRRKGVEVEVKSRKVTIHSLKIEEIDMANKEVTFEVTCSKGTYIRTICSDLGEMLGCGASMSALTRTASGIFRIEDGVEPEALKDMDVTEIEKYVIDTDKPLVHFGRIEMNSDRAKYFSMGNSIRWKQIKVVKSPEVTDENLKNHRGRKYSELYSVFNSDTGEFLGTGYYDAKEKLLKADKILVTR